MKAAYHIMYYCLYTPINHNITTLTSIIIYIPVNSQYHRHPRLTHACGVQRPAFRFQSHGKAKTPMLAMTQRYSSRMPSRQRAELPRFQSGREPTVLDALNKHVQAMGAPSHNLLYITAPKWSTDNILLPTPQHTAEALQSHRPRDQSCPDGTMGGFNCLWF